MKTQVLNLYIVDDDPSLIKSLSDYLDRRFGSSLNISAFNSSVSVLEQVDQNTHVVLLDNNLEGNHGSDILRSIKRINPSTEVIILSSHEDIASAIESYRKGASEYVVKGEKAWERIGYAIYQILAYPIRLITREFKVSKFLAIFFMTFITIGIIVLVSLSLFRFYGG